MSGVREIKDKSDLIPANIVKRVIEPLERGKKFGDTLQEEAHAIRLQRIEDGSYNPNYDRVALSDRDKKIVRMSFEGMTQRAIHEAEGVARITVCKILNSPLGRAYKARLEVKAEEAITQARSHLASITPRAVRVVDKLIPKTEEEFADKTRLREVEDTAWKVIEKTFPKSPSTLINLNSQTNVAVLQKEMNDKSESEILDIILTQKDGGDE